VIFDFSGTTAVVTGGASGIGAEVVAQLARFGATVVAVDVTFAYSWEIVGPGDRSIRAKGDVQDRTAVQGLADLVGLHLGGLDILVNAAGIFPRGSLADTDDALWDRILDVNLKGVFHCCQAFVPLMKGRDQGAAIVNVGSVNATAGAPNLFAYSVSKGGVSTLTRNLAKALAAAKIRVNCVHPGWVLTPGEMRIQQQEGRPANWPESEGRHIPLGRILLPEDIAPAIVFLSSPEASQITGQEFAIDGGFSVH